MKKLLQIASFFIISSGFAQNSILITNTSSSQTVAANGVVFVTTTSGGHFTNTFDIKNTSASTQTYVALRYDPILNPGADAYFCFGGTCYGPSTTSSNYLVLTAGQSASQISGPYQMLTAYIDEAPTVALSHIKYSFKNINDAADSLQISLRYNDPTAGIKDLNSSVNVVNVYPNPSVSEINLKINSIKAQNSVVYILNNLGQVVITRNVSLNAGMNIVQVDIKQLDAGNYFINCNLGTGIIYGKITVTK